MWLLELFRTPYKLKHLTITSVGNGIAVCRKHELLATIIWDLGNSNIVQVSGFEKHIIVGDVFDYCLEIVSSYFRYYAIHTPIILIEHRVNKDYLEPILIRRGTKVSSYVMDCRYILHPSTEIDISDHKHLIRKLQVPKATIYPKLTINNIVRKLYPVDKYGVGKDVSNPLNLIVIAPLIESSSNDDLIVTGKEFYAFPTVGLAYRHHYARTNDKVTKFKVYHVLVPEDMGNSITIADYLWDNHITSSYLCESVDTLRYCYSVTIDIKNEVEQLLVSSYGDGLVIPHSPVNIKVVNVLN